MNNKNGIGTLTLIGILFIALKLTNWSWWWITLPFWVGVAIYLVFVIYLIIHTKINKKDDRITKEKNKS